MLATLGSRITGILFVLCVTSQLQIHTNFVSAENFYLRKRFVRAANSEVKVVKAAQISGDQIPEIGVDNNDNLPDGIPPPPDIPTEPETDPAPATEAAQPTASPAAQNSVPPAPEPTAPVNQPSVAPAPEPTAPPVNQPSVAPALQTTAPPAPEPTAPPSSGTTVSNAPVVTTDKTTLGRAEQTGSTDAQDIIVTNPPETTASATPAPPSNNGVTTRAPVRYLPYPTFGFPIAPGYKLIFRSPLAESMYYAQQRRLAAARQLAANQAAVAGRAQSSAAVPRYYYYYPFGR